MVILLLAYFKTVIWVNTDSEEQTGQVMILSLY